MNTEAFAMVRNSDGEKVIDIATISGLTKIVQKKADKIDRSAGPTWAHDNPQIEIVPVTIITG